MALARRTRYIEQNQDTKRYVGQRRNDVFAVGKDGQRLNISGTDYDTGGVGPVTNNEIFGGESMGADWAVTTSDSGVVVVGSRQAIFAVGSNNADAPRLSALHSGSGTQSVDGNITIVIWAKLTNNAGVTGGAVKIGFAATDAGIERAVWQYDVLTNWKPYVETAAGSTTGAAVAVTLDTWTKFKVIIKTDSAEFYINGVLKETLNGVNIPDTEEMSAYLQCNGDASDTAQSELRVRRVHTQYGTP